MLTSAHRHFSHANNIECTQIWSIENSVRGSMLSWVCFLIFFVPGKCNGGHICSCIDFHCFRRLILSIVHLPDRRTLMIAPWKESVMNSHLQVPLNQLRPPPSPPCHACRPYPNCRTPLRGGTNVSPQSITRSSYN